MCCHWLQRFVGVSAALVLLSITGCYSMNGYVMNASGLGYYDNGNYAMAAQEFQTALASNPRNADYMANLAKTKMKIGDPAGAEQLYQQALSVSPSHQPSYHGYSELLLAQNRGQEALRMMNAWAATQPYVAESHVELAWLQRELGQNDAAARSLQTALQVNPNHATALAHLGQYYQDSGNSTQAVALYQQALRANWNQPEVHSRLAVAAEAAGANHPMGEMAMARGMHPNLVARQQYDYGRPPAGVPQTVGGAPMPAAPSIATMPPAAFPPNPQQHVAAGTQTFPPADPYSTFSPMMPMAMGGGTITSPPTPAEESVFDAPASSSASLPAPIPDPAFQQSDESIPVTSVSSSAEVGAEIAADEPAFEAF